MRPHQHLCKRLTSLSMTTMMMMMPTLHMMILCPFHLFRNEDFYLFCQCFTCVMIAC